MTAGKETSGPADPRFFTRAGPFGAEQLAQAAGAELVPAKDAQARERSYAGIAPYRGLGLPMSAFWITGVTRRCWNRHAPDWLS